VSIYLDGVAGGSRRPFSAGWLLFLEVGTTFSGYLQQQIGDNQLDKICTTQTPRFCLGTVITVATVITRGQANSDH
jgi:hypothetical protein